LLLAFPTVDLTSATLRDGMAALVSLGMLTQERAAVIITPAVKTAAAK
jgi:hypothetical protein